MKATYLFLALLAASPAFANDVDPFGFEKQDVASTTSRAQVRAELNRARAAGQLPVTGEIGVRFVDPPAQKTRAQIVAETREARRLGLLDGRGELGPIVATPEQQRQIELAGLRVIGDTARR
jgi:hypothetical protein